MKSMAMLSVSLTLVLFSPIVRALDDAEAVLPPASAFDMSEMLDPETLEIEILSDAVVPAEGSSGKRVRKVAFRFLSQVWGGEEIRNDAVVYVPAEGVDPEKRGLACISQGGSSNLKDGFSVAEGYGEDVALRLGIPAMLLMSNMPGDHFGIKGQGPVRRYTTERFFETGDPNWIHWIALAKIYMRGMTALDQIDGIDAERFVLSGSSKRAQSIWIVAATDDRVAGIVAIARPGNFTHMAQRYTQGRLKTPDGLPIPSNGGRERMAYIEDLYTRRGYEYMAYIDPYYFLSRVTVPVMYIIGTNDQLFDSFNDHGFYPFYTGDKSFAYVPNYGHGKGTETHADLFHAWIAHCFWGRSVTHLTALANPNGDGLNVEAIVRSDKSETREVNLYYCVVKGEVFSDAKDRYVAKPMTRVSGTSLWRADVNIPENVEVYWYVEAVDWAHGLEGCATTLLERMAP
jgi:hypothetical protein